MIYSLHGTLVEKTADMAVVECAGVGYCVSIPSSTAGALPAVGQTCTLYTYMNVTENDVSLFGFADKESQAMFRLADGGERRGPQGRACHFKCAEPGARGACGARGGPQSLHRRQWRGAEAGPAHCAGIER